MRKSIIGMAFVIAVAGCQQAPPNQHGEEFAPDSQVSQVTKIMDAQANRGARADGTLYVHHFDGRFLNSLGMAKLDSMIKDQADPPIAIWLDIPDDGHYESRRMSVAAYLKDKGVPSDEVVFGKGANPEVTHPAAQGLKDLPKTEEQSSGADSGSTVGGTTPNIGTSTTGTPGGMP
jgi:hypothetical protein